MILIGFLVALVALAVVIGIVMIVAGVGVVSKGPKPSQGDKNTA